ncbi:M48 family metallopeptidase [bacterium]|nr:M48 family metallopeptidase [bacterium]
MNYELVRCKRRTVGLHITQEAKLVVRVPLRAPLSFVEQVIAEKTPWINRTISRIKKRPAPYLRFHPQARTSLIKAYKKQAKLLFKERVELYAQAHHLTYSTIKINSAKRRWGSCSIKGNLNFTWRLVLAPLWVLDYVVVHELAHLKHHNHSHRFWEQVAMMYPNYKEASLWLKLNSTLLLM